MSSSVLSTAWVQMNSGVGDLTGNLQQIVGAISRARAHGSRLIVFPELALTGYPPEDLLLRPDFIGASAQHLSRLLPEVKNEWVVVGALQGDVGNLYNALVVIHQGKIKGVYHKQHLPNYGVFDEQRYFAPGSEALVLTIERVRVGFCICEDLWSPGPMEQLRSAGAECVISINASPFHLSKHLERLTNMRQRVRDTSLPLVYLNTVGGQDELVFDGRSFFLDTQGKIQAQLPQFRSGIGFVDLRPCDWSGHLHLFEQDQSDPLHLDAKDLEIPTVRSGPDSDGQTVCLYQALVRAVRDYVDKNGFKGALLGLSGGIDSALTLCVAVDALGADAVTAVMMPYEHTSHISIEDAAEQASNLGVSLLVKPIHAAVQAFSSMLADQMQCKNSLTLENLQARCRGVVLMALSNASGALVLTTGNKSELAVGYCTLYGDMAGGFNVLKDVCKTWVYRLAHFINRQRAKPIIPNRVITRPPSAELSPNQTDQDTLPDYHILDQILAAYIEEAVGPNEIIARGFDQAQVIDALRRVDLNEYKRRQGPIGPKVTKLSFGRDRRHPVTQGFRPDQNE